MNKFLSIYTPIMYAIDLTVFLVCMLCYLGVIRT